MMFEAELKRAPVPLRNVRFREWPLAVKTVAGFFALHLVYRAILYALNGQLASMLDPALHASIAIGIIMSFALLALLGLAVQRGLGAGLALAAVMALPTALAFAAGEWVLYYQLSPEVNGASFRRTRTLADGTVVTQKASGEVTYLKRGQSKPTVIKLSPVKQRFRAAATKTITFNATGWFYFFFGLGTFFVGMASAGRLREAQRRAAAFERLAQSAQLRALRYQVNPHFLFNTLNSLSSLIMARRSEEAEVMILSLSNFFRSTLAIDPTEDVTLSEEIALQRLYLDIERVRFPERLAVEVDIPDALAGARVPALLLQPVVENAIKYGVARSRERVTLAIRAENAWGQLRLTVENDGLQAGDGAAPHGTGVGLANVGERLSARFGEGASCHYGPQPQGGYRVTLTMPLVTSG